MFFTDLPLFWGLLLGHLLGDFYLQGEKPAAARHRPPLLKHCVIYGCCMLFSGWALCGAPALWAAGAAALGHAVIDGLKFCLRRLLEARAQAQSFLIGQLLSLAVLTAAGLWRSAPLLPWIPAALSAAGCVLSPGTLLRLGCLALLLGKPANVLLKICNPKPPDGPDRGQGAGSDRRAGAVIGTLERLLTASLFLLGQYGAISVVFAAKTLTRYHRIADDPPFGEYYLIGTLGSLLAAVLASVALFPPV